MRTNNYLNKNSSSDCTLRQVRYCQQPGARYTELLNPPHFQGEGWGGDGVSEHRIITPYIEPHNTSVYAQYTVLVENREAVQKKLNEAGIPTAVHYPITLNLQPAFAHLNKPAGSYPISEGLARRVMSMPMGADLAPQDQDRIANALFAAIKQ